MANNLSAGVSVFEKDNTASTPQVSATTGASVIEAGWGPIEDPQYIASENDLVETFGKPNNNNFKNWFTAANFLAYTASSYVTRADSAALRNASVSHKVIGFTTVDKGSGYTDNAKVYIVGEGKGADAAITLLGDKGEIEGIAITKDQDENENTGRGYRLGSTVVRIDRNEIDAKIEPVVTSGKLTDINFVGLGTGYKNSVAKIKIIRNERDAELKFSIDNGAIRAVDVVDGGNGYQMADSSKSIIGFDVSAVGTGTGAELAGTCRNGVITAWKVESTGDGYPANAKFEVQGTATVKCVVSPVIEDGKLTALTIEANDPYATTKEFGGYGYSLTTLPTIKQVGGKAPTVKAVVTPVVENGVITKVEVTNSGSGYKESTIAVIHRNEQDAEAVCSIADGGIRSISVTNVGEGYSAANPPSVTITSTAGEPITAASAHVVIGDVKDALGVLHTNAIKEIVVDSVGVGYTKDKVTIALTGGTAPTTPASGFVVVMANGVMYNATLVHPVGDEGYLQEIVKVEIVRGEDAYIKPVLEAITVKIKNEEDYSLNFALGEADVGEFACKYAGKLGNSLMVTYADKDSFENWQFIDEDGGVHDWTQLFAYAPGTSSYAEARGGSNDELHVLVVDAGGLISGTKGTVLEKYEHVSKARDCKSLDGVSNFYKRVLLDNSKYVYWMDYPEGKDWNHDCQNYAFPTLTEAFAGRFGGGTDDYNATDGQIEDAYYLYRDKEKYDITLLMAGPYKDIVAKYIIENVCEYRKDCMCYVSPNASGAPITGATAKDICRKTIAWRENASFNVSSSYAFLDSGWKYQYDKYNDEYRWLPLNGDIAGLRARTNAEQYPWFSEAGYTRGQIKNVVRLSFNPSEEYRDLLYPKGINPVVTFVGEGTVLYGDKTLLSKPSCFQHSNCRFLFIHLEKTLAKAAKAIIFQINDAVTQKFCEGLITPFLDEVLGNRGIYAYKVICDSSVNTSEVIDANRFVCIVKVQPARSINFVELTFVAEKTGSSFTEAG